MGLHSLLTKGVEGARKKNRWIFNVDPYIGGGVNALPPSRGARPSVSFKEFSAEHLHETVYLPGKAEWNTLELSLYDVKCKDNVIFNWMKGIYDPTPTSQFYGPPGFNHRFRKTATLTLFSGGGVAIETWIYMNASPNRIDWGELDMASSELAMVDLTIRYDRAYILKDDGKVIEGGEEGKTIES